MKYFFIVLVALICFGCSVNAQSKEWTTRYLLWKDLSDSSFKYFLIYKQTKSKCSKQLWDYYYDKRAIQTAILWPQPKYAKVKDVTCYPIKK